MVEDYLVTVSAGVTTASLVILLMFLAHHRRIVNEANASSRLGKDIWNALESRLKRQDERIIDLMVKFEVHGTATKPAAVATSRPAPAVSSQDVEPRMAENSSVKSADGRADTMSTGIEQQILRTLAEGAKTSTQIKELLGKSREHTARVMKSLFERGLVLRSERNKPYLYELTESGRTYLLDTSSSER